VTENHTHITKRDQAICDFCSGEDVEFRYPCETTIAIVADTAVAESNDDWSACALCAALVDAGDPVALAAGVLDRAAPGEIREALALIPGLRETAVENLTELYSGLLPRLGKPTRDIALRPGEGCLVRRDKDGRFQPIEAVNGYQVYDRKTDTTRGVGDGVDMFFGEDGEAVSPGTPEFWAHFTRWLIVDEETIAEAYFASEESDDV
jgi:hypothetical protein